MNAIPLDALAAAMRVGDFPSVEALARTAMASEPQREELWLFLAIALHYQGRRGEALEAYRRLTEIAPENSTHWSNYATALFESGLASEAEPAFHEAIRLDPANPAPYLNLGLLLLGRKDYLAARDTLLDAYERDPDLPAIRIHAATACCNSQDFDRAEKLVKPWRQWLPLNDPALQLDLASTLLLLSDGPGAQLLLEDLMRTAPPSLETHIRLAGIYERMNRIEDAEAALDSAVNGGLVADEDARKAVSNVRAVLASRRKDYSGARALLEASAPRSEDDAAYYFTLAGVHDKLGESDLAMRALDKAHEIKVAQIERIDPDQFAPGAPAAPIAIPDVSADDYRAWPKFDAPDMRHSPIFVVGFPRSGTTLLEQMLDAHPGLQSMDENPYFNRLADTLRRHDSRILGNLDVLRQYDVDELRKQYLLMVSEKIARRWDARLVDKNPLNMLWLPFMHRLFPNSKYILAIRHPCDVLLSCYMQNFRSSILLTASASLERLARAYVAIMECWLRHEAVFKPDVLVSRYEDVVEDLPGQAKRLAAFLELEDATPMLGFDRHAREKGYIGTPSYSQVIEPVNKKAMNRWLRYRKFFEPVLPILEPMLEHWGYPTG